MLRLVKSLAVLGVSLVSLSAIAETPAHQLVKNVTVDSPKTALVRNRPQTSFTDNPQIDFKNCQQKTVCTREFRPTVCTANGAEVKGNNRCEALANLRRYACLHGYVIQREDVSCRYVSTRVPF